MTDQMLSPDGKWMWTGSEWIPAPPSSTSGADSTINLEDSIMSGDVKVEQNSNDKFEGSDELFSCNPLEYAKLNGFVESSERKKRQTLFDYSV